MSSPILLYLYRIMMSTFTLLGSYSWSEVGSHTSKLGGQRVAHGFSVHHCSIRHHCMDLFSLRPVSQMCSLHKPACFRRINLCFTLRLWVLSYHKHKLSVTKRTVGRNGLVQPNPLLLELEAQLPPNGGLAALSSQWWWAPTDPHSHQTAQ